MPSTSPLSPTNQTRLDRSSRQSVRDAFFTLRRYLAGGNWLGPRNIYKEDCIQKIRSGVDRHIQLAQYVAASVPLHCMDGWGFLGRAMGCLINGDSQVARHLGYYSELRATMSLLAAEGIGIFDYKHASILANGTFEKVETYRTHGMAWKALENWSKHQKSGDILGEIISPEGIALKEWLQSFGAVFNILHLAKKWFDSWGIDLEIYSEDQYIRNEASYRPTRIKKLESNGLKETSEFLVGLWDLCEPNNLSRFHILDLHLLRLSLESVYESVNGKAPKEDLVDYEKKIEIMLNNLSITDNRRNFIKEFLLRKIIKKTPEVFRYAEKNPNIDLEDPHFQILSRAFLLLRVATGATAKIINDGRFKRNHLNFWWKPLGEERGFWNPNDEPSELMDLWLDVQEALININDGSSGTFKDWREEKSSDVSVLVGCERICLWGLEI